jgi:5-methylcytosine-specific restriction endonuclease McrA
MKKCKYCSNELSRYSSKKFCNYECQEAYQLTNKLPSLKIKEISRFCVNCKQLFSTNLKNQLFCSVNCCQQYDKSKRPSFKEWNNLVEFCLERDFYKCIECDSDKNLVTHHEIPLAFGGSNDIENLITLCGKCHHKKHGLIYDQNRGANISQE